jgi:hypothetical protein
MDDLNLGLDDVILEIVDDVQQAFTSSGNPGFLVSPKVTTMMNSACTTYNSCLEWCEGACLRTISVLTGEAAMAEDIKMIVSDGSNEISIKGDLRSGAQTRFSSVFIVALPQGTFQARFQDSSGNRVWPRSAAPIFEASSTCLNHVVESDFTLLQPDHGRPECDELIFNGNLILALKGGQIRLPASSGLKAVKSVDLAKH